MIIAGVLLLAVVAQAQQCSVQKVATGEGCWALANKCKISQDDLKKFNPGICDTSPKSVNARYCCTQGQLPPLYPPINGMCQLRTVDDSCWGMAIKLGLDNPAIDIDAFNQGKWFWQGCGSMAPGDTICVGPGNPPPDPKPKQKPDGYCFDYVVKENDTCTSISKKWNVPRDQIELFNGRTHRWRGCEKLEPNFRMCLSNGLPPLPPIDPKQMCGLASPGNATCPLNVCCGTWGFCGATAEFCTELPNNNGCQSNCGMGYRANSPARNPQLRVGYFESWNEKRPCNTMSISEIPSGVYSHIHYAFVQISANYNVEVESPDVFEQFKAITGVKKIISFGGWAFNDPGPTQTRFSDMVANNRARFIEAVVAFADANKLDGLDFDWEYPSAPDRGGRGADADNYLAFVKELKDRVKDRYSISIAAPASLWYLQGFKIAEMSKYLDYIVYMTYDIHGQWDYHIKWTGPYLRSHADWPETMDALAMIVKAGVPSNKVLLGIGHYGRAFKQADANCFGPTCTFQLNKAKGGTCTQEGGYLSMYEIEDIKDIRHKEYDSVSRSTIMTFGTDQWVAYTDEKENQWRREEAMRMGLGGTVEWAIDLMGMGIYTDVEEELEPLNKCFKEVPKSIEDVGTYDEWCRNHAIASYLLKEVNDSEEYIRELTNSGSFDFYFGHFKSYMEMNSRNKLSEFMSKSADKVFQCLENGKEVPCHTNPRSNAELQYNFRTGNRDAFLAEMEKEGISKDWVGFMRMVFPSVCYPRPGRDCIDAPSMVANNYPHIIGSEVDKIASPKPSLNATLAVIPNYRAILSNSFFGLDSDDAVDSTVVQVSSLVAQVENAKEIWKIGAKVSEIKGEAQAKLFVALFLGVLTLPFIMGGAALIAAGGAGAAAGTFALIVGVGANAAVSYHEVEEAFKKGDALGKFFAILGLGLDLLDLGTLFKAARTGSIALKAMTRESLQKIGPVAMKKIDDVTRVRVKRMC